MRRLRTGWWLCVACWVVVAPAAATETANEAYFAALAAGSTGDVSAAGEPLRAQLAAHPSLVRVRRALMVVDDYEAGRIDLEVAAAVLEGQGLIERQEWAKAEERLAAAVERAPEYYAAWHDLGRARFERGDTRQALVAYETALRLKPDHAYSFNNLALVYWRLGDAQGAVDRLRQAIELEPGYCNAYNTLGWIQRTLAREDEARESFKRALALCPDDPWPEANLAWQPPPVTRETTSAARATDETPTRVLVGRLASKRAETRRSAAEALAERRDAAVLPALRRLLGHRRDAVRATAAHVLGAFGDDRLVGPLTQAAEADPAWIVRQEATIALGRLAPTRTSPTLFRILADDPAYQVRQATVLTLCPRTDCESARALREALRDRGVEVRAAARACLARLGGPEPPSDPAGIDDWITGWCVAAPDGEGGGTVH